jgi:hypothetical protein
MKIEIGTTFYRLLTKRDGTSTIVEYTVTSVGKKYFYCDDNSRQKFDITTLFYKDAQYSQDNIQLYRSAQEILDLEEANRLFADIRYNINYNKKASSFTLQQLIDITAILNHDN